MKKYIIPGIQAQTASPTFTHVYAALAAIINTKFLQIDGGKAKFMAFYAKQSRGLMARWMADHRPKTVAALRNFDAEGYTLSKDSTDDTLVFTRPKPLPIAQRRKTG